MTSRLIPITLLAAVLGAALISHSAAQTDDPKPAARTWEHLALTQENSGLRGELGAQINRLGRDGWELICVTPVTEDGTTMKTVYYFKRPK